MNHRQQAERSFFYPLCFLPFVLCSCVAIYGWNIHAPGLLSDEFARDIPQVSKRVALYIPEGQKEFISKDKGTRWSDPQTYYIGEAFVPMLIESFQSGFTEFVLLEALPNPEIMSQYAIDAVVVSEIKDFKNRKTLPAQGLDVYTETAVFNRDLKLIRRFETRGTSEAKGTFAKKGGLEVNLNAAIEGSLRETVLQVQDALK
ncbi:MAG TPA: hypothetical protein PLY88_02645 [Candidatus Omnitrophota bacterium]|mgnify:CR=1 FL=1|nr:hypothetical protein [Candidatus Omnitrophota bacterium]